MKPTNIEDTNATQSKCIYECEYCGYTERGIYFNDENFAEEIKKSKCNSCGKSTL
ncbi:MAG: hypothetical protein FWC94_02725 [Bacteroidales bacterium]|nr:hypothetical protein [Bacteroidales bacterium]